MRSSGLKVAIAHLATAAPPRRPEQDRAIKVASLEVPHGPTRPPGLIPTAPRSSKGMQHSGMSIGGSGAHLGCGPDRFRYLLVGGALDTALDAPSALGHIGQGKRE